MDIQVAMSCAVFPTSLATGDSLSRGKSLSRSGIGRGGLRSGLHGQCLSWSSRWSENALSGKTWKFRFQDSTGHKGRGGLSPQDESEGRRTPAPFSIRRAAECLPCKSLNARCSARLRSSLVKFFKLPRVTLPRRRNQSVHCDVGVTPPLEESKPESKAGAHEHFSAQLAATAKDIFEEPKRLSSVPEGVGSPAGRTGLISFYAEESGSSAAIPGTPSGRSRLLSLIWLLGPLTLVASVVLPPLYLRKIFGSVLEDSLVTDFVILFFTETLFFVGAAIFLYVAHFSRLAVGGVTSKLNKSARPVYSMGYSTSAKIALGSGILLPLCCFVIVWPWTGPAAAAALAPYMIGLLAQLGFEKIILMSNSPVWPLVPITFQMYRLHQLNRAAQLVAGLLFSLKGVEATAETMAINGSLQTLLLVLQVLGMLCLWSLGSFLTNQLPTTTSQYSIPSLP